MSIKTELWKTFRFPLLVGIFFGLGFYYISNKYLKNYDYLSEPEIIIGSIIVGGWMFCVPFGFRCIEYMTSKIAMGTWIIPLIIYIPVWIVKFAIAIQFAPLFLLIYFIMLLYRLIKNEQDYNCA